VLCRDARSSQVDLAMRRAADRDALLAEAGDHRFSLGIELML